ncbi:MAG: hypothetical protein M3083_15045 [Actinomycetota bacterium]|nr:hypothetical protein [Actinomycetota bacterium]
MALVLIEPRDDLADFIEDLFLVGRRNVQHKLPLDRHEAEPGLTAVTKAPQWTAVVPLKGAGVEEPPAHATAKRIAEVTPGVDGITILGPLLAQGIIIWGYNAFHHRPGHLASDGQ